MCNIGTDNYKKYMAAVREL